MPWLRIGDTAANHPTVVAVLEHPKVDGRLTNEVFGFVVRCAAQSTAHLTDYVINRGTALAIAGFERAQELIEAAVFAGYFTEETRDLDDGQGARKVYRIIEDPEFIHMRTKEEIEWERDRKKNNSDPALIIPVRLRDGDACRYCGLVVSWTARKGRLAGTYDHRQPGKKARTIDDSVVACTACNSSRKDDPQAEERLPLMPVPTKPYFHPDTIKWIAGHDWAKRNGFQAPEPPAQSIRPGEHSGNGTPGRTESNGTTGSHDSTQQQGNGTPGPAQVEPPRAPADADDASPAETRPAGPDRNLPDPADPAGRLHTGSGYSGSGRDGPGRDGKGRSGAEASVPQPRGKPKRSSRRNRPRKRKG